MTAASDSLAGKVALVTGGANGIGEATVRLLLERGAHVAFTDIVEPAVVPDGALFIRADATSETEAATAVAATIEVFGAFDIAVHNVGNFGAGDRWDVPMHETDLAAWNATVTQCLTTSMIGTKHAIAAMRPRGGGAIVNIASLAGIRVTPFASPAYTAAKAGVVHLSEQLAVLYAPQNIRINVVAPGLTLTPNIARTMPHDTQRSIAEQFHPMGRLVTPQEVAEAIVWTASPAASGVTGLVVPVDGGWAAK